MKLLFSLIVTLLLSNSLFAMDVDWNQFNHAFSTKAEYQETPFGFFATLTRVKAYELTEEREYFSAVGGFNANNEFVASRHEIASEKWEQIDDTLHIDQWLFVLNSDHKLIFKLHRQMIQRMDGVILKLENIPETEEAYSQRVDGILSDWMKSL